MTNHNPLTARELQAVAYFAVGVTSEGSIAGRDVSYRLSFAGRVDADGRMRPVANSGYSFGTLQIDLGQHPEVARSLLDHYQAWAAVQPDRAFLELGRDSYEVMLTSLQRTGRQMRADNAIDIDRSGLNRFLGADEGRAFVHGLDALHVDGMTAVDGVEGNRDSALERLQRTTLYRQALGDEQAELAGLLMKLQNQAGRARWPALLDGIEAGVLDSSGALKAAIDALLPNQPNGAPDYLQSGADNTVRGVSLVNALRGAHPDNPLSTVWTNVLADPLVGPVAARRADAPSPDLAFEYETVRSMFLTPEASGRLVAALDRGASMAEGDPELRANGSRQAGFYASGRDFVHWNRNGQGHAFIGGHWRSINPDSLNRVRSRDGTTELLIDEGGRTRLLLRVDPRIRALRADRVAAHGDDAHSLTDVDRAFIEALRERMGPGYSDAHVLTTLQRARDAGFRGPQAIEASCEQDGTFFMRGDHTTGYSIVRMAMSEPVLAVDALHALRVATHGHREHALESQLEKPLALGHRALPS